MAVKAAFIPDNGLGSAYFALKRDLQALLIISYSG